MRTVCTHRSGSLRSLLHCSPGQFATLSFDPNLVAGMRSAACSST